MTVAASTRLGPYEIVAPIGAGGLGEVEPSCGRERSGSPQAKSRHPAQRGDRDRAMELLRESVGRGFVFWNFLHTYVFLEPLHGYPPFEQLIKPQG